MQFYDNHLDIFDDTKLPLSQSEELIDASWNVTNGRRVLSDPSWDLPAASCASRTPEHIYFTLRDFISEEFAGCHERALADLAAERKQVA